MDFKDDNIIQKKSSGFELKIIELYQLCKLQNEFVISKQLLRCGTSIGANVEESIAAQSKSDFISKLSIANKEARETKYWLKLYEHSKIVNIDVSNYLLEIEHIINILTKIIKTTQENQSKK